MGGASLRDRAGDYDFTSVVLIQGHCAFQGCLTAGGTLGYHKYGGRSAAGVQWAEDTNATVYRAAPLPHQRMIRSEISIVPRPRNSTGLHAAVTKDNTGSTPVHQELDCVPCGQPM